MRNVELQNVLARYPGDVEVLVTGDVSIDGAVVCHGEECASVKDGTKGASGVQPIESRRRTARVSSGAKKKGAKKRAR